MATQEQSNKNIQKLIDMGYSRESIDALIAQGDSGPAHGIKIDDKDIEGFIAALGPASSATPTINPELQARIDALPDSIKNSPEFKALTPDQQEISVYNYEVQLSNNEAKATALANALEQATAQADPYWRNLYAIAQDEVLQSFEQARGDFESSLVRQQNIIQNINQDLSSNKEFYSLEQQKELTDLSRNYQSNVESVVAGAADRGLTFSTKRKIAEQKLAEENQGLVESSQRQYNKQITELQNEANRGNLSAQQEISDLQRRLGETQQSIGLGAESTLGTANMPTIPGYVSPLTSPTIGTMGEDKIQDINARKNTIFSDLTNSSLALT